MQDWISTTLAAIIFSKVKAKAAGTEVIVIATTAAVTTAAVEKATVTATSAKEAMAMTAVATSASLIVATPISVVETAKD